MGTGSPGGARAVHKGRRKQRVLPRSLWGTVCLLLGSLAPLWALRTGGQQLASALPTGAVTQSFGLQRPKEGARGDVLGLSSQEDLLQEDLNPFVHSLTQ